jgi:serine/threonine-protein kinase
LTLAAGTQIGKYVVRRKIAEGGMAEIYLCASTGPEGFQKEVVIKRVRAGLAGDSDFVEMFIAEARLASQISHANVVQIFDFDKHEDTYYLAMEYVRGRSLWDLRKRCKERMTPLPPLLVAQIGREVAAALHGAHQLTVGGQPVNLVHRDVSPHNVLLSYDGAVKLTDFGIAKAGNRLSAVGVLKGKFAYMSPEQSRGEAVDPRTDVFALGIVLWELLTGGRLFEGDSDIAVLRAVQQSVIAPPRRLNPDVGPGLDEAVMKALTRDLDQRFQSAQELERALAAYVFANARSYDDTDVGGFLRGLFAQELEAERALEQAPMPSPMAASPPARLEPGSGRAGTLVLQHGQRPVLAEPPPPPAPEAPSTDTDPAAPPLEQTHPRAAPSEAVPAPVPWTPSAPLAHAPARPRAPRWPLAVGGTALIAALAVVGLRSHLSKPATPSTQPPKIQGPTVPSPAQAKAKPPPAPVLTAVQVQAPAPQVQEPKALQSGPTPEPQRAPAKASPPAGQAVPPTGQSASPANGVVAQSAPAEKGGTLVTTTFPWAAVWIDGVRQPKDQGMQSYALPAGNHTIRFRHGKLPAKTIRIHLAPGQTKTLHYDAFAKVPTAP